MPVDPLAGDDLAAEAAELGRQGIGHGQRPAADHRPAHRVGVHAEDEPERSRQRPVERDASSAPQARRTAPAPARRGIGSGPAPRPSAAPAGRIARAPAGGAGRGRRAGAAPRTASARRVPADRTAAATRGRRRSADPGQARRRSPRTSAPARPRGRRPARGRAARRDGSSSTPWASQSIVRRNGEASGQRQDRRADVVAEPGEGQLRGPGPATDRRRPPRRPGPIGRHGPG